MRVRHYISSISTFRLIQFLLSIGKRNDDENAKEKLFVYATYVPVTSFKGLETTVVDTD